jgi:long-chain acyl-CoA synthetase
MTNVIDMFEQAAAANHSKGILRSKRDGIWRSETFDQWRQQSNAWAKGLIALGLQVGDRVNIIGNTNADWVRADIAILKAGGVTVPIFQSNLAEDVRFISNDSGSRFVFAEDPFQVAKLLEQRASLPHIEKVIYFSERGRSDTPDRLGRTSVDLAEVAPDRSDGWLLDVDQLVAIGAMVDDDTLEQRRAEIAPDQPCTFVYTSGTTGKPKGVVLTHDAFVFEVGAVIETLDLRDDDTMVLFMPLAHIFAKVVYFVCLRRGIEMIFPTSVATLIDELGETRPTIMPSVPRIFEKVHTSVVSGANKAGGMKKRIFDWALAIGKTLSEHQQNGEKGPLSLRLKAHVAHRLVFSKLHDRLGGRIRYFISGGAPLSRDLAAFFHAFGLLILEGYGLTENCAAATVNMVDAYRFGTVGKPLPGVEVAIAEDGEILISGRNILTEYHDRPEATADAISVDESGKRWLHSGDIGEIDTEGYLSITDRKKDIIVTAGGKNIAPQNIENHIKSHPMISQAVVYGDRRKFLSALLTLNEENLKAWTAEHGVPYTSYSLTSQNSEVFKAIESAVQQKNRGLASYETIKKFAILESDLSEDAGDLTPTLKVKRKALTRKYKKLLDSFYDEKY